MTYCVGWRCKGSVFLLADTAVTKPGSATHPYSSAGELHAEVNGEVVEEAGLKLAVLAPGVVAAYAGYAEPARRILSFMRDYFQESFGPLGLFRLVEQSMGPFDPEKAVEILLAHATAGGEPTLTKWSSLGGISKRPSDIYSIGSLRSYHSAITPEFIARFAYSNVRTEDHLAIVLAVVQSYGVHDVLTSQGVGGLIFGLYVSDGAVNWQPDTNYLFYDPEIKNINFMAARVRENCVIVSSSFTDEIRIFANSVNSSKEPSFLAGLDVDIKLKLENHQWRYWFLLETAQRRITVVRHDNPGSKNRYIAIEFPDHGRYPSELLLSDELWVMLRTPFEQQVPNGTVPYSLRFLVDS